MGEPKHDAELLALGKAALRVSEHLEQAAHADGRDGGLALMRAYAEASALEEAIGVRMNMHVSGTRQVVLHALSAQLMALGIAAHERADGASVRCRHGVNKCPLRQVETVVRREDVATDLQHLKALMQAQAERMVGRLEGYLGYSIEEVVARAFQTGAPEGMAPDLASFELEFGMRLGQGIIVEELQLGDMQQDAHPIDARLPDVKVPLFLPEYFRLVVGARHLCDLLHPPVTTHERGRA